MAVGIRHSVVQFSQGSVIFRDGDPRQALYIIQKGHIAIYKLDKNGERIPLGIVGPSEFLGEDGLLDNKPRHGVWAVALDDCDAIKIPVDAIEEQLKSAPQWLVGLAKGLAQKLQHMNDLVRRNQITDENLDKVMEVMRENDKKRKGSS